MSLQLFLFCESKEKTLWGTITLELTCFFPYNNFYHYPFFHTFLFYIFSKIATSPVACHMQYIKFTLKHF